MCCKDAPESRKGRHSVKQGWGTATRNFCYEKQVLAPVHQTTRFMKIRSALVAGLGKGRGIVQEQRRVGRAHPAANKV